MTPRMVRVAPGDYESSCGWRMYRLVGVAPAAWNVEDPSGRLVVDGAATMRDALALLGSFDDRREGMGAETRIQAGHKQYSHSPTLHAILDPACGVAVCGMRVVPSTVWPLWSQVPACDRCSRCSARLGTVS